jgi:hypothetical protein
MPKINLKGYYLFGNAGGLLLNKKSKRFLVNQIKNLIIFTFINNSLN